MNKKQEVDNVESEVVIDEAQVIAIRNANDLKLFLAKNYLNQVKNFFGDEKQAMKFLSSVMADVQKNPKLMECEPISLVNSYMTMAQLGLMPSGVSGEAYVLPYKKNKKVGSGWVSTMQAQFQLGYQGLITLFYKAGGQGIRAEIIRENDKFTYINGVAHHEIDWRLSNEERGKAIAVMAAATVNGLELVKVMNVKDVLAFGKKFSKSFDSEHTPWDEENDPELWMLKKTVLKQLGKMMPKNETISKALSADNVDSKLVRIEEREATPVLAIDIPYWSQELDKCTTKEQLERVWADMPGDAKIALKDKKEQIKSFIADATKEVATIA